MNRRSLFKLFGGAAAAYVLPIPTTAAPAVAVPMTPVFLAGVQFRPTAVLTNAFLDEIYRRLTELNADR